MKYKGYTGLAEIDEESGVLYGRVIGLRDVITFQGKSVKELTKAFHDSVDDYLEFCAERGESPDKPFSGQFIVRLSPEMHQELSNTAEAKGVSVNSLVKSMIEDGLKLSSLNLSKPAAHEVPAAATTPERDPVTGRRKRRILPHGSL